MGVTFNVHINSKPCTSRKAPQLNININLDRQPFLVAIQTGQKTKSAWKERQGNNPLPQNGEEAYVGIQIFYYSAVVAMHLTVEILQCLPQLYWKCTANLQIFSSTTVRTAMFLDFSSSTTVHTENFLFLFSSSTERTASSLGKLQ